MSGLKSPTPSQCLGIWQGKSGSSFASFILGELLDLQQGALGASLGSGVSGFAWLFVFNSFQTELTQIIGELKSKVCFLRKTKRFYSKTAVWCYVTDPFLA